jgi:hypothetical protein
VVADRNRLFEHARRAQIVIRSAKRLPAPEGPLRAGVSQPAVWRWQALREAPDSLLFDKTHKPSRAPLSAEVVPGT